VKSRVVLFIRIFQIVAALYISSCSAAPEEIPNNISFHDKLSDYGLFKSTLSDLIPVTGVEVMQIASPLFTDYTEKQRLLKIPSGKKASVNGNGLPTFPDGTIIAKTFYYSKTYNRRRRIIETRLLILNRGKWNAATYQWNAAQTNADLLVNGAIVPVAFEDHAGVQRTLKYKIPAQNDCSSCHRSGDQLVPIGPKAQNLNITVNVEGKRQNQLAYFIKKGIFSHSNMNNIGVLPNYNDTTLALAMRARAYLDVNCAHCHQPAGMASNTSLNLGYAAEFEKTGIDFNKQNILIRMSTMGEYHMPKTGTTVLDEDGVELVRTYIKSLDDHPD
jgi:uncharacterized repeat protein (TIGR03806 family)